MPTPVAARRLPRSSFTQTGSGLPSAGPAVAADFFFGHVEALGSLPTRVATRRLTRPDFTNTKSGLLCAGPTVAADYFFGPAELVKLEGLSLAAQSTFTGSGALALSIAAQLHAQSQASGAGELLEGFLGALSAQSSFLGAGELIPGVSPGGPSFVLTLDTTGPVVSYGTPTGADPDSTLVIPYVTNEAVARAVLHLVTGDLELTVSPSTLSVALPANAPGGPADITVYDAYGNGARSIGVVTISGEVPEPPAGGVWRPYRKKRVELDVIKLEGAVVLNVGAAGVADLVGDSEDEEILIVSL